jgi:hypothetical protein
MATFTFRSNVHLFRLNIKLIYNGDVLNVQILISCRKFVLWNFKCDWAKFQAFTQFCKWNLGLEFQVMSMTFHFLNLY